MGIISKIKRIVREKQLQSELQKFQRNRSIMSLKKAKKIGMVYDASEEQSYKKISDLVRFLQNQGKIVKALGHLSYNNVPHYCDTMLSYDFFLKKDINWWGKPCNTFVKDFVAEEYDILIDLNVSDIPSITYVTALSKAKFKVGLYNEHSSKYFDLMIRLDSPNLNEYVKQLVHYLGVINQEAEA